MADRPAAALRPGELSGPSATTVVLVRHAWAGSKRDWPGDDDARPLDETGRRQAAQLSDVLAPHRPARVLSAPPLRCTDTVRPLAERLGLDVEVCPALGAEADDPAAATALVLAAAATAGCTVLCSQGEVLPDVLAALLPGDSGVPPPGKPAKGSAWVLSFAPGPGRPRLVGAESWPGSG